MTLTTLLSARVREIEQRAAPLPDLLEELEEIMARKDELEAGIERATQAARQLKMIDFQVQALLDGTGSTVEITGGQEPLDEPTPEPEDAPKVPDVAAPEPVVVGTAPAAEEATREPEPDAPAPTIVERVLTYLAEHPNRTAGEIVEETDMHGNQVSPALSKLFRLEQVKHDGRKPYRYRLPHQAAPQDEPEPVPEPDAGSRLKPDEREMMDLLSDGALYKEHHVQGRLRWPLTRVQRTLGTLTRLGLIREHENHYVINQQAAD